MSISPALDVDSPDRVAHHRHEDVRPVRPLHLKALARRQPQHRPHNPDRTLPVDNPATGQLLGPPLVLRQLRRASDASTSRPAPRSAWAASRSSQPSTRTIGSRVESRQPDDPRLPAAEPHGPPELEQGRPGPVHVEAPVQTVRPSDVAGQQAPVRATDSVDDVKEHALSISRTGRPDDRPQRVGRPPASADHLAVVVRLRPPAPARPSRRPRRSARP